MIHTPLNDLLGIKHPVLLAPMAGVAGGALASAVSRAGGFGIVGGGYGEREFLKQQLDLLDRALPFGIGFITWRLDEDPSLLDLALSYKPKAILLSFGSPEAYAEKIKRSGSLFITQCQNLEDARTAATLGADIIIAQGTEAGGHGSHRATMSLLPAVVDALPGNIIVGAGGIADGRGLAACLCMGADGAMLGSRFYVSEESLAAPAAKQKSLAATGDQTTRSSVFDVLREYPWPKPYNLRTLRNPLLERYENDMPALLANKEAEIREFNDARANLDFDRAPVIIGEAVDLITDLPAAGPLVERIIEEAEHTIHASTKLLQP